MPYDYYEYFKKLRDSKDFTEAADIVRNNLWSETVNFKKSQKWLKIEDKILIKLYKTLRYS